MSVTSGCFSTDSREQACDARGLFERRPFGHVDDHLELALVVERQHLHFDELYVDQRHGAEQQQYDHAQKAPAQAGVVQHVTHEPAIEPRQAILCFVCAVSALLQADGRRPRA